MPFIKYEFEKAPMVQLKLFLSRRGFEAEKMTKKDCVRLIYSYIDSIDNITHSQVGKIVSKNFTQQVGWKSKLINGGRHLMEKLN